MTKNGYKEVIEKLLTRLGITINGSQPWDIQVHNEKFYQRVLAQGSLGLGESYMDGWWDAKELDQFFDKLFRQENLTQEILFDFNTLMVAIKSKMFNMQSKKRSHHVAEKHYDLGNDFYEKMLDKRMLYTCAYWKDATTLDEAQENKLELICQKILLDPNDNVLDLGCGWGSFSKYAAEKYGSHATAYNISKEQVEYARKSCEGLPVEIVLSDYREATGVYDKVVAIGLTEHVGHKNYRVLMQTVSRCLKDHGIFLLHTIGDNSSKAFHDPWFDKYIFPNGMLPSVKQLAEAAEGIFIMEDWHNLNVDYDRTLMAWYHNFNKHWPQIKGKFDERFYRMWKYYLLVLAGAFRCRNMQLWQVVFSKKGVEGGYKSVR